MLPRVKSLLAVSVTTLLLQGCALGPGTGLAVAGLGGHQFAMNQENIAMRSHAALHEESDLLTFSVEAISRDTTDNAVSVYLEGYNNPKNSKPIRALAIYQVGLIYMNLYNRFRDDEKAAHYLELAMTEFDLAPLNERIKSRLATIKAREDHVVILTADQYLMNWKKQPQLPPKNIPHDDEMKDFTARAITTDRIQEAILLYTLMYENEGSTEEIKASSLYQIGLMYMSPYNENANESKALEYFVKIQREFPSSHIKAKANLKSGYLINHQKAILE